MTPDDEDLLEHVFDHLCEEQAEVVADLPDKEIRRRAWLGIGRARSRGLSEPEAITAFVSLMFLVSPRFDEQPAIAAALADRRTPEKERIGSLFSRTAEADWDKAAELGREWPS